MKFIRKLLEPNPKARLSAENALEIARVLLWGPNLNLLLEGKPEDIQLWYFDKLLNAHSEHDCFSEEYLASFNVERIKTLFLDFRQ
jgi:hypothetical protein